MQLLSRHITARSASLIAGGSLLLLLRRLVHIGSSDAVLHVLARSGCHRLLRLSLTARFAGNAVTLTPLLWAVATDHLDLVRVLAQQDDLEVRAEGGLTALALAAARGNLESVKLLLAAGADASSEDAMGISPLHLAAMRGDDALIRELLAASAALEAARTCNGSTPLLLACESRRRWPCIAPLLEAGANASAVCRSGKSGLMALSEAKWSDSDDAKEICCSAQLLLQRAADANLSDCFGQTALHIACRRGPTCLIALLCASGAQPGIQDNDGIFSLQLLCSRCLLGGESELVAVAFPALLRADAGCCQQRDFSDSSALLTLCHHIAMDKPERAPLKLMEALVAAGADVAAEEEGGWTAAHFLVEAEAHEAAREALAKLQAMTATSPFWSTWEPKKARTKSNSKYLSRRGGHHRLALEVRSDVLRGDLTLQGISRRIKEGRSSKVLVLLGAGASTSSGIPDFRSPSGLWTEASTRQLFSAQGFIEEPEKFWRMAADLFMNKRPTRVHQLLARMAQERLLTRIYTQNIDGLEMEAGLSPELVVQCHGTASKAVCMGCGHSLSVSSMLSGQDLSKVSWKAPRCSACKALMRPEVVFFGEPLPDAYGRNQGEDLASCDLLLVIGTALSVYPVAGLVKQVKPLVPRLLISREAVGLWRERSESNYRDVFLESDCDAGAVELARLLGWTLGEAAAGEARDV